VTELQKRYIESVLASGSHDAPVASLALETGIGVETVKRVQWRARPQVVLATVNEVDVFARLDALLADDSAAIDGGPDGGPSTARSWARPRRRRPRTG
jgi:hypothetical protein